MSFRTAAIAALALTSALAFTFAANAQGPRRRADANGDGKISLQEFIAQRGKIFDRIDANHDGQITKDEVAAFQGHMESARAGAMIRSGRDRPEGGRQIERLAELTANGPVTRAQWDAVLTRRFKKLDTAGTGYITMEQMRPRQEAMATPTAPVSSAASPQ
jgi:Ca2+-binding EF-hand superfamily protein